MSEFPQWGFWVGRIVGEGRDDAYNTTSKRHLFLTENKTACGYDPAKTSAFVWRFSFSSVPKIDGIYEVLSEMKRGRLFTVEDFPKCKRCLKLEGKKK